MSQLMLRTLLLIIIPVSTLAAEGFERPIPQPQSATAEIWYAVAAVMLCAALYVVHRMVSRR